MTEKPAHAVKQRAAAARTHATSEKRWRAHITAAAVGTLWRPASCWIEQGDGAFCAELAHVSTGKIREIRLPSMESVEDSRVRIASLT